MHACIYIYICVCVCISALTKSNKMFWSDSRYPDLVCTSRCSHFTFLWFDIYIRKLLKNEMSKWWMTIIQCCGCMGKMAYSTCLHLSMFFIRCREKQRKEASRLQTVNRKLSAMNKLLMEENDRLQKQVSQLVYDNGYMKQQIHTVSNFTLWIVVLNVHWCTILCIQMYL